MTAPTPPRPAHRLPRQASAVIVALASLAAACGCYSLNRHFHLNQVDAIRVGLDQPADWDGLRLTVSQVRAGAVLKEAGSQSGRTSGRFVALNINAENRAVGREQRDPTIGRVVPSQFYLVNHGMIFGLESSAGVVPQRGFGRRSELAFDVAPDQLEGLQLVMAEQGVIEGFHKEVIVDLGIDAATAARMRESTEPVEIDAGRDDWALP